MSTICLNKMDSLGIVKPPIQINPHPESTVDRVQEFSPVTSDIQYTITA
jgi:hypothetical protein